MDDFHLNKEIINKFDRPGPRYTSYPTAPVWNQCVTESVYRDKLQCFGRSNKTLSLYVHLPFCQSLCRYCGCNVIIRPLDPVHANQYLDHLETEISLVSENIGRKARVTQMHWGGGTPTFLNNAQIERLHQMISKQFDLDPEEEAAIEIDPRRVDQTKIEALRKLGFNRVSFGVQDFDDRVMRIVNRFQSRDTVERVYEWCRKANFTSVNFDLIYGLPGQTPDSFLKTISTVITMAPDRVALYSFAYIPDVKKHQNIIKPEMLPTPEVKLEIFLKAREKFILNGYDAIGMDHFALGDDAMAKAWRKNQLYRNFMGYTVKPADEFIGLGLTSIGFIEKTFVQNDKILPKYYQKLSDRQLPVERGIELTHDDEIRQYVINELMCHFQIDKITFYEKFNVPFDTYFINELDHLNQCQKDALLVMRSNEIIITPLGKIFIRIVCVGFDHYYQQGKGRQTFSRTI
jgi:oxygen-independent coproporphyrinogen III oxidase